MFSRDLLPGWEEIVPHLARIEPFAYTCMDCVGGVVYGFGGRAVQWCDKCVRMGGDGLPMVWVPSRMKEPSSRIFYMTYRCADLKI